MKEITIRAVPRKFQAGWLFIPATKADKQVMQIFCEDSKDGCVTLNVTSSRKNKSFEQVKTVWALVELIYEVAEQHKPTATQAAQLYMELIELYADRVPSIIHRGETVPVTLSQMDKEQAVRFIQNLINHLSECGQLSDIQQASVSEIFKTFEEYKSGFEKDPVDVDSNGNWLTIGEWRKRNNHSFASGLTKNLEVAHIVTRGSSPQNIESVWNLMLLTHEEHIDIQHGKGWDAFLDIYPHLRQRVNRARRMAGKEEFTDSGKKAAFDKPIKDMTIGEIESHDLKAMEQAVPDAVALVTNIFDGAIVKKPAPVKLPPETKENMDEAAVSWKKQNLERQIPDEIF